MDGYTRAILDITTKTNIFLSLTDSRSSSNTKDFRYFVSLCVLIKCFVSSTTVRLKLPKIVFDCKHVPSFCPELCFWAGPAVRQELEI